MSPIAHVTEAANQISSLVWDRDNTKKTSSICVTGWLEEEEGKEEEEGRWQAKFDKWQLEITDGTLPMSDVFNYWLHFKWWHMRTHSLSRPGSKKRKSEEQSWEKITIMCLICWVERGNIVKEIGHNVSNSLQTNRCLFMNIYNLIKHSLVTFSKLWKEIKDDLKPSNWSKKRKGKLKENET